MHLPCNKLLQDFYFTRSQKGTLDRCFKIRLPGRVTADFQKKDCHCMQCHFRESTDAGMAGNWFRTTYMQKQIHHFTLSFIEQGEIKKWKI